MAQCSNYFWQEKTQRIYRAVGREKLGDVAETASGGTPSRSNIDYYKGRICWFTTSELTDNYLHDSNEHITNEALLCSSAKLFHLEHC